MIELQEVKREATEQDALEMFTENARLYNAVRKVFTASLDRLTAQGVEIKQAWISFDRDAISVRLNDYWCFHEEKTYTKEAIFKEGGEENG